MARTERVRPVQRVIVPIGGTDREFIAQEQAVEMAAALDVPLVACHVRPDPESAPSDLYDYVVGQADRWGVELQMLTIAGTEPAAELLQELSTLDLLVIGTWQMGRRYHVGSVAEAVLARAPCPLLVVRLDHAGKDVPLDEVVYEPA